MLGFYAEKCVHCRYCEKVCSTSKLGHVRPSMSAIRLTRDERFGPITPHVCNLCAGRSRQECVAVCPTAALSLGTVIEFNAEQCIDCGACVTACPEGAVAHDPSQHSIVICDLCGGTPMCIGWCPENVLSLELAT